MNASAALFAVIAAQAAEAERRALEGFRVGDATRPERARALDALGINDDDALRRLVQRGVVREAGSGVYYLDEVALAERRRAAQPRAVRVALIGLLVFLGVLLAVLLTVVIRGRPS